MKRAPGNLRLGLFAFGAVLALAACGDIDRQPRQPNERPTAVLVAPTFGLVGERIVVDASGSSDVDGTIFEYRFSFGDSDEVVITGEALVAHTYDDPGAYTITLTVVDDRGGKDSDAAPIDIR